MIEQLNRQAARIVTNRVIAGSIFRSTAWQGGCLGIALGGIFCARCGIAGPVVHRTFNASYLNNGKQGIDFNPFDAEQELGANKLYGAAPNLQAAAASPLMKHLWDQAAAEWSGLFQ